MIPIMAIMGAAQGAMSLAQGIKQGNQADALKAQYPRPKMAIPKGVLQAENIYRNNAYGTRLPGQGYLENQLQQSTANGMRAISEAAQDPASKLAAIGSLYGQQMQAQDDIGYQAAQNYYGNQFNYANFLGGTKANAERDVFNYNKIKPYEEAAAAASAMEEASLRNKSAGTQGLMGSIGGMAGMGIEAGIDKKVATEMFKQNWENQNPYGTPQAYQEAFGKFKNEYRFNRRYGGTNFSSMKNGGANGDLSAISHLLRGGSSQRGSATPYGQEFDINSLYNPNYLTGIPYQ